MMGPDNENLMLKNSLLVLGGTRSGKSRYALEQAESFSGELLYVATAQPGDAEMAARIDAHRRERSRRWQTFEETVNLPACLRRHACDHRLILVDCLTLWLSNLMAAGRDVERETEILAQALTRLPGKVILVSNEVGMGIAPVNALARRFRDEAGRLNQRLAQVCGKVVFVIAGLPVTLKT